MKTLVPNNCSLKWILSILAGGIGEVKPQRGVSRSLDLTWPHLTLPDVWQSDTRSGLMMLSQVIPRSPTPKRWLIGPKQKECPCNIKKIINRKHRKSTRRGYRCEKLTSESRLKIRSGQQVLGTVWKLGLTMKTDRGASEMRGHGGSFGLVGRTWHSPGSPQDPSSKS